MTKIFEVNSTANNVTFNEHIYDNVMINWYIIDRENPILPYSEAIADYNSLSTEIRLQMENYVNEKFTLEEANQLKEYLKAKNNITKITEINFPLGDYRKGFKDIDPTTGTGIFKLHKSKDYHLSFKVEGFFNVKFAREAIRGDNKETVITKLKPEELERIKKAQGNDQDEEKKGDKTRIFLHSE